MKQVFAVIFLLISFMARAVDSNVATQSVTLQVAGTALLAITGPPVVLKLAGATEAGDSVSAATENNETRLRISSLVQDQEKRSITAKLSEALTGTQLSVELGTPNTNFSSQTARGDLKGEQLLSNESDAILVDGIGTCWSGKNEDDGYVIKYKFKAIPGAPIVKGSEITITYTISLLPSDANE